jgi:hypothetical protein
MSLVKTNTNQPIRDVLANPNKKMRAECHCVIAMLTFADLQRGPGTLHTEGDVRLDMQGRISGGGVNLQIQIGGRTIAAVIVAATVQQVADPDNQRGVANAVISALNQSLDSGTIWQVSGTLP